MDLGGSYMNGPSRKTVVVEVPTMAALTKAAKSRQTSYTPSTVSEFSNEIDTPATSVAATPIESTSRKSLRKGAMNKALLSMGGDVPAATKESPIAKGKRKRTVEEDQVEDDEMLARALQDEEYAIVEPQDASSIKGKRELQIADSEDEDEDEALSDLTEMEEEDLSEESDFEPPSKKPRTTMQRGSTRHARGRPRQNATHSSKQAMPLEDQDDATLSSDDLSEFAESYTTESVDDDGLTGTAQGSDVQPRTLNRPFKRPHGVSRTALERAKLEHAHPEITTMWETLRDVPVIKPVKGPQPPGITRQLKSFQLEGVDWMRKQEASQWGGGLLGDEMGMGKTIQAVSLIMSDWPAKEPTLVLVPPVALMQWSSEINQYTDGKLKVLVHHNSDPKVKKLQVKDLKKYDVILISYSGLESMYRKESKGWKRDDGLVKENSRIHAIHYHRLILDEAHSIKSRTTGVAKACFALKGRYKWCLSGTPVQNRIGEFFSLLRFLEVRPFASYFCKKCDCAEIHWQQDERKSCTYCHHSGFQHVSVFNQGM
jgi:DNA repair protein RAD16